MKVRLLYTTGSGEFNETEWDKPEPSDNELEVKSIMTGVCRSDIDMMLGQFGPLPLSMQGHEGLGLVTKVGKNITNVSVGSFVATRGEPAYADYYNVRKNEFVVVPEAHPRYILEPVACGINVVDQAIDMIKSRAGDGKKLLIMGTGFLAWVAYHRLLMHGLKFEISVVGTANRDLWGDMLLPKAESTYDVVIDLSSRTDVFDQPILNENALVILGAQKKVETDFGNLLWKAVTMVFPSPRNPNFHQCMIAAEYMITNEHLDIDRFWSKAYNRDTQWQNAFADGMNRAQGYSRGYIQWV